MDTCEAFFLFCCFFFLAVATVTEKKALEALELHITTHTHTHRNAAFVSFCFFFFFTLLLSVLLPTVQIYVYEGDTFSGANLSLKIETLVYKLLDGMIGHALSPQVLQVI